MHITGVGSRGPGTVEGDPVGRSGQTASRRRGKDAWVQRDGKNKGVSPGCWADERWSCWRRLGVKVATGPTPPSCWGYSASLAMGSRLSRCSGRGGGLKGSEASPEGEFYAILASHPTPSPRTQYMKPQDRSWTVGLLFPGPQQALSIGANVAHPSRGCSWGPGRCFLAVVAASVESHAGGLIAGHSAFKGAVSQGGVWTPALASLPQTCWGCWAGSRLSPGSESGTHHVLCA